MVSPGCRRIKSLTTSSSIKISWRVPPRKTLTLIFEASSSKLWNSDSLLYSEKVATNVAKTTAIAIPNPSYHGANPNAANARVTNKATIKIIMIGSFRFAISLSQKVSTSWVVTAFEPCWFLESRTSCSERPVYVNFMNGLQGLNQITQFC